MGGQGSGRKVTPKFSNIVQAQGVPLELNNLSGAHDAGRILKTPTEDTQIVNKKYVDDQIAAIPSSSPAGNEGEIQFNEASAFQADSDLFWDNVNKILDINGSISCPGTGADSETFGIGTIASGSKNLAVGKNASAIGDQATAIGYNAQAPGNNSFALGYNSAAKLGGTSVGVSANTDGGAGYNTALGYFSVATGQRSIAVGWDATSNDVDTIAMGYKSLASNDYAMAFGNNASATHHRSIVFGRETDSTDTDQFVIGNATYGLDLHIPNGNVGIGTTTPTQPLSVEEKVCMTALGGMAIKLTNKTGANSVKGQLVDASTGTDDAVNLLGVGGVDCVGVFLESGVSDGSEAWIVISGIADVQFDTTIATVRGNWVGSGTEAGNATNSVSPPAAPTHFEEIGHCIESKIATPTGISNLARCVLHFN